MGVFEKARKMSKNRYYVVYANKSESGYNELWERVDARTRQRLLIETKTRVARKLCRFLNDHIYSLSYYNL